MTALKLGSTSFMQNPPPPLSFPQGKVCIFCSFRLSSHPNVDWRMKQAREHLIRWLGRDLKVNKVHVFAIPLNCSCICSPKKTQSLCVFILGKVLRSSFNSIQSYCFLSRGNDLIKPSILQIVRLLIVLICLSGLFSLTLSVRDQEGFLCRVSGLTLECCSFPSKRSGHIIRTTPWGSIPSTSNHGKDPPYAGRIMCRIWPGKPLVSSQEGRV